ncbi:PREDICTED: protein PHLOEM PROTEIN 2-LIKE A8-like [Brassica oleracea var. oleracea]|uniref:protein PHLOEM PROTEIN 2-LIKE A8-like n=1 Tax=Brassica oleracea var. oleracea TaxID=109376 RepID=UPI0006A6B344|nr:PREDICTED: protein PHLOEM PROTEIN 2-LIKE A8-like [Brassica oleracea var. oleracea]
MDVNSRRITNHQVFVSFRGEELRCGFVSHLVEALQRHGINVFIDKLESVGQDLSNLFARIEESTIALVIFSRRYTESRWCLDELVIPIFFKVEPVTVKQLRGAFGDKFRDREWEYRCDKPRTGSWKEALASVSCKTGLTFDRKRKRGGQDQMDISRDSVLVHQNSYIANQIVVVSNTYMDIEYQNSVLRAQLVALRDRLQSLNSVIKMSGVMADVFLFTANTGLC